MCIYSKDPKWHHTVIPTNDYYAGSRKLNVFESGYRETLASMKKRPKKQQPISTLKKVLFWAHNVMICKDMYNICINCELR